MPEPTPEDVLSSYTDFIQRCQSLTISHQRSYPAAVHVRSAQELVDSARSLIDVLDRYPGVIDAQPLTGEKIATALRLAVPALLVHSRYVTPPMPGLPFLLDQLTRIDYHLNVGRMEGRLREAGQALEDIRRGIIDVPHTEAARDTAARRRTLVRRVLHVSHRLVPFLTTATAAACAPLLLPAVGGIAGALAAVGSSLAGVLLPSRDELRACYHSEQGPPVVPQSDLLATAAKISLDEAAKHLPPPHDPARQDWALLAWQAANQHLNTLLAQAGDSTPNKTRQSLVDRARRIRASIDALIPPPDPPDIRHRRTNGPHLG